MSSAHFFSSATSQTAFGLRILYLRGGNVVWSINIGVEHGLSNEDPVQLKGGCR